MEMVFEKMEVVLGRAYSALVAIRWDQYGAKLLRIDPSGVIKYQGFMLYYQSAPADFNRVKTSEFGYLPDPAKSYATVKAKIDALRQRSGQASLELRNPPFVWGGAVRTICSFLLGLTGLPEVVDHIVTTKLLRYCGQMSKPIHDLLLRENFPGSSEARALAGMSIEQYQALCAVIDEIILAAAMYDGHWRG